MKKNLMFKNAGAFFMTAILLAGIFTSCNNDTKPDKTTGDSITRQSSDSSKMMNTTVPTMPNPTKSSNDSDTTKSGQTPPPKD